MLTDTEIIAALWPDLTCCGQVWSDGKAPSAPAPGSKPAPEPAPPVPRPPTPAERAAWPTLAEICYRRGLQYDAANEVQSALWHAYRADGDPAWYAAWRRAEALTVALFNDYAEADRVQARVAPATVWG